MNTNKITGRRTSIEAVARTSRELMNIISRTQFQGHSLKRATGFGHRFRRYLWATALIMGGTVLLMSSTATLRGDHRQLQGGDVEVPPQQRQRQARRKSSDVDPEEDPSELAQPPRQARRKSSDVDPEEDPSELPQPPRQARRKSSDVDPEEDPSELPQTLEETMTKELENALQFSTLYGFNQQASASAGREEQYGTLTELPANPRTTTKGSRRGSRTSSRRLRSSRNSSSSRSNRLSSRMSSGGPVTPEKLARKTTLYREAKINFKLALQERIDAEALPKRHPDRAERMKAAHKIVIRTRKTVTRFVKWFDHYEQDLPK